MFNVDIITTSTQFFVVTFLSISSPALFYEIKKLHHKSRSYFFLYAISFCFFIIILFSTFFRPILQHSIYSTITYLHIVYSPSRIPLQFIPFIFKTLDNSFLFFYDCWLWLVASVNSFVHYEQGKKNSLQTAAFLCFVLCIHPALLKASLYVAAQLQPVSIISGFDFPSAFFPSPVAMPSTLTD